MAYDIRMKRIYSDVADSDGARVLVDRLWPRGKPRESLALVDWYRGASPSNALRRDWQEGAISRAVFAHRYRWEMQDNPDVLSPLMRLARRGPLTLLSADRDLEQSYLPVLRDTLLEALAEEDRQALGVELSSSPCYAEAGKR